MTDLTTAIEKARSAFDEEWFAQGEDPDARYDALDAALRSLAESLKEAGVKVVGPECSDAMLCGAGVMPNYDLEVEGGRPDDDHRAWWKAAHFAADCLFQQAMEVGNDHSD